MVEQLNSRHNLKESGKLAIRRALQRFDLHIGRGSPVSNLMRTMDSHGVDTVIDVGANVGQFGALLRAGGFRGRLISCEPMSAAFQELRRRSANDSQWEVLQTAVGTGAQEAEINLSANSYSSSLLPMTDTHLQAASDSAVVGTEMVQMTPLTSIVADHGIDPGHTLLKVDTQGYEAQVLDSAGPLLPGFAAIQLELSFVELYVGQPLFDDLRSRMDDQGLRLHSLEPGISGADGRLLQCDGLFVRREAT